MMLSINEFFQLPIKHKATGSIYKIEISKHLFYILHEVNYENFEKCRFFEIGPDNFGDLPLLKLINEQKYNQFRWHLCCLLGSILEGNQDLFREASKEVKKFKGSGVFQM